MEIIIGKDWLEKTKYYMQDSLTKPSATWIVMPTMKAEYEEMLLKAGHQQALLTHRVITFSELLEEKIKQKHLFALKEVNQVQGLMFIYELIKQHSGKFIKATDLGTLKEIWRIFHVFHEQKVDLTSLDEVDLPPFSKIKLKECYALYQLFLQELNKQKLFLKEDFSIISDGIDEQENYYIDTYDYLSLQEIDLLKQMKHCTVLMTCDNQKDTYTGFVWQTIDRLSGNIRLFESDRDSYQSSLIAGYQNLRNQTPVSHHCFYYHKALNQGVEINKIAGQIYHKIVSKQAKYSDFVVYCHHQEDIETVASVFKKHQLPVNTNTSFSMPYLPIYIFIQGLFQYALTPDINTLIMMLRTHLFKHYISDNKIDYIEKTYFTLGKCQDEEVLSIQKDLDDWAEKLRKVTNGKEISRMIYDFIISQEMVTKMVDEQNRHAFKQTLNYLEQFSLDIEIDLTDYRLLFLDQYQITALKEENKIEAIDLYTNTTIAVNKKYYYILGCNEEQFPLIKKDHGLLLNDEITACRKGNIDLGINLFEEIEREYLQWFKLFLLNKEYHLSYSSGSLAGDDLLPSSLYLSLKQLLPNQEEQWHQQRTLSDITNFTASKDILLKYHYADPLLQKEIHLEQQYRQSKNQPEPIQVEDYLKLIAKNNRYLTSPSELETYNGCPFKYYLRYGMNVFRWQDSTLKANDFGTIVHDVLDVLSDLYNQNKDIMDYINEIGIDDIEEEYRCHIYPDICDHSTLSLEDQALFVFIYDYATQKIDEKTLTAGQKYLYHKLIHDLFNTIKILMYHTTISQFRISEHEAWVSKKHGDVTVQGRLDRQDSYQQYIKVVDYKSSNKALDLCLATLGFNIQMLLYLDMLCFDHQKEYGGVLYFNTKQRVVKMNEYFKEDELDFEKVLKEYRMEGYLLNEETLLKAIDSAYDPSVVARFKYVKSKQGYSGNLLDKQAFSELLKWVNKSVDEMIDGIYHQADIRILPSHSDLPNINMLVDPCTYCDYSSVCLKDVFYNENREIEYVKESEMLKRLEGENND